MGPCQLPTQQHPPIISFLKEKISVVRVQGILGSGDILFPSFLGVSDEGKSWLTPVGHKLRLLLGVVVRMVVEVLVVGVMVVGVIVPEVMMMVVEVLAVQSCKWWWRW